MSVFLVKIDFQGRDCIMQHALSIGEGSPGWLYREMVEPLKNCRGGTE